MWPETNGSSPYLTAFNSYGPANGNAFSLNPIEVSPLKTNPLVTGVNSSGNLFDVAGFGQSIQPFGQDAPQSGGGGIMDWLFGSTEKPGNIGSLAGIGQTLFNGWLGMQQYGLAKKKLEESKRQYDQNYDAQKNLTNSMLADRQNARVAANPNAGFQSASSYLGQYGVK